MNKLLIFAITVLGLGACNETPKESFDEQQTEANSETTNPKYNAINLQVNKPTVLDSSDWIHYPLTLQEIEETDKGFKSSSYGRQYAYWNIAFYNTETKETRLLSDSLKMLINSISSKNEEFTHSEYRKKSTGLIYYSITIKDFNQDGKLNSEDPKYLFISDLSGKDFKQVSPDDLDLSHWLPISETNKVLIQAIKDINNDKKFDNEDEVVSFIYDITNEEIEQVFGNEFILMTKKLLENQWAKKK